LTIALFAGRFDPVTNGHLDIARRASRIFDNLIVGVSHSSSTLFSTEERVDLFTEAVADHKNVEVKSFRGLTVDFARQMGVTILVRSMRGTTDFDAEFDMALMNRKMSPELEPVFLISSLEYIFISGTRIREVAAGGSVEDIAHFVPPHVAEALKKKLGRF
jgi:pantetheine-phosphate adenylyltransferase